MRPARRIVMEQLPNVVIIGRPNVGKSSLLNCLVKRRISIVDATPGVTRDRIAQEVTHQGRVFRLIDTGGIGIVDSDDLSADVERQIAIGMAEADLVVFVIDVRAGVEPLDKEVAERLRQLDKPVLLVANKVESDALRLEAENLTQLGFGPPMTVSSIEGFGRIEILDTIVEFLGEAAPREGETVKQRIKVALVGKRNAGKSTLLNRLAGAERVAVSEVAGTTRDAVDVTIALGEREITMIDTAGVRRKKSIQNSLDFYSTHRTERSIRRADVVMMLVDATQPLSRVDKKLSEYILENHKPVVVVVNKWDLTENQTVEDYRTYFDKYLPAMAFAPVAGISAKTGLNVMEVFDVVFDLYEQAGQRVGTGVLNRIVDEAVGRRSPGAGKAKVMKLKYATQVGTHPPYVVVFVNDRDLVQAGYTRYLAERLRSECPFSEVPIRIDFRNSRRNGPPHKKNVTSDSKKKLPRGTRKGHA
jgi:GTP-binding protein